jgi:hypothetical protein
MFGFFSARLYKVYSSQSIVDKNDFKYLIDNSNTIGNFSINKEGPKRALFYNNALAVHYYPPVYFHIKGAISFEKSDK